jgi:hypothetical protein
VLILSTPDVDLLLIAFLLKVHSLQPLSNASILAVVV